MPASLNSTIFPLPADVVLGDLHVYDPAAMAWTDLSAAASGTPPSPRAYHGFKSAGGLLYVHGGFFADLNSAGGESRSVLPAGVL